MKFTCILFVISMAASSHCLTLRVADRDAVMMGAERGMCMDLDISGICDKDHSCPSGYVCRYISILPGTQACIRKGPSNTSAKRAGRCPSATPKSGAAKSPMDHYPGAEYLTDYYPAGKWGPPRGGRPPPPPPPKGRPPPPPPGKGRPPPPPPPPARGKGQCNDHEDCPENKRCCPISFANVSYCVDAEPIGPETTVTPIIVGVQRFELDPVQMHSGTTLIQSNGFNVLVDVAVHRIVILDNMLNLTGLLVQDIDMVVETHGHPEHYSGAQQFHNVDHVYNTVTYNGPRMTLNPLSRNEQYFLNNDRNIEVIKTPGHTPQDVSVIVRNVPDYGTIAIVGDLIGEKDDGFDKNAYSRTISDANRKKVACMSDWILPGHGPMFEMDADQKAKFGC